jgi:hypothetical protein
MQGVIWYQSSCDANHGKVGEAIPLTMTASITENAESTHFACLTGFGRRKSVYDLLGLERFKLTEETIACKHHQYHLLISFGEGKISFVRSTSSHLQPGDWSEFFRAGRSTQSAP